MFDAVKSAAPASDVFVSVAAVADYRVKNRAAQKLKKGNGGMSLELEENPDILAWVAALPNAPFCVGFAAESEKLAQYATEKRAQEGRAADGRQPGTGSARRRRQRDHALRRARRASARPRARSSSSRAS